MIESRRSATEFLANIKQDECDAKKGKLKIFLGYAAGVGKTYAMLNAAHEAKKHGVDVVIGYIEPHVRPETIALLDGLKQVPTRKIHYKGKNFEELDIDAVLTRKPEMVLIDELAHTNLPMMRHLKRYGDVEELLEAGIHVYTTVNIQHIESLQDLVEDITGIKVHERIPDYLIDNATQLNLVDIEPEDLIQRLQQGKIYSTDQAKKALQHFFKKSNLETLREIALRRTADAIYHQKTDNDPLTAHVLPIEEHILVGISSSPTNAKVIRAAARLARALPGKFTGLYVQSLKKTSRHAKENDRIQQHMKLIEQLGGHIVVVHEEDIASAIASYAQFSGVTKLVIGRTTVRRKWWPFASKISDSFTELLPNVAIHIVPDSEKVLLRNPDINLKFNFQCLDLLKMVAVFSIATLIGLFFFTYEISESNIITIYILAVLILATWTFGWPMNFISSLSAVLMFNFFFTEPRFSFEVYHQDYPMTFFIMFLSGIIASSLTRKVKEQSLATAQKSYRTEVLLETNRKLQHAKSFEKIISVGMEQIIKIVEKPIEFFEIKQNMIVRSVLFQTEQLSKSENQKIASIFNDISERGIVTWVANNKLMAGVSTDTFPEAKAYYLPVLAGGQVTGVIGIPLSNDFPIPAFERHVLHAIINDFSFALDKKYLQKLNEEVARKAELEQMRANLLRAISHDLRTPLTTISGNADILLTSSNQLNTDDKQRLYEDIYNNSKWLIQMVENLLSVSRLENGELGVELQPEIVLDIMQEAISHVAGIKNTHLISYYVKPDLLMAIMDARLIIQVFINLIDNALTYTPAGSEITLTAKELDDKVLFSVKDNGPGVDHSLKEKLFDPFITGKNQRSDSRRGLGLGLSLCQTILKLHGSELTVLDNEPTGAIFSFSLEKGVVIVDE